jgi:hypothetical protein
MRLISWTLRSGNEQEEILLVWIILAHYFPLRYINRDFIRRTTCFSAFYWALTMTFLQEKESFELFTLSLL